MMTVGLTKIRQGKTRSIELALYFVVSRMRLRPTPSPDKGFEFLDISSKERRRIESAVDVSHGVSRL